MPDSPDEDEFMNKDKFNEVVAYINSEKVWLPMNCFLIFWILFHAFVPNDDLPNKSVYKICLRSLFSVNILKYEVFNL